MLGRDAQGIVGQLDLAVAKLGNPARLNAVAVYDAQKQKLLLTANVADVHAGALAAIDPVLGRFSGADVTLSGRLTSSMDLDGRIGGTTFDLAGGQGTLTMPSTFEGPLAIRSLALAANFDPESDRLTLAKAELQFDGPRLQATGTIDGVHAGAGRAEDMRIGVKLTADDISLADLPHYWPVNVKVNPRTWIATHVSAGAARLEADVALTLPGGDPADTIIDKFVGTIAGSGLTVHYLDPLPPVEAAAGTAHFTSEEFTADFTAGHIQGLQIDGGTLRISGMHDPEQIIDIDGKMHGPLSEALTLLDNPRLGYLKKLGIQPDGVGGTVAANLTFSLPAKKGLTFDQVQIGVAADIADAAVKNAMLGQDLNDGDAKLTLDHDGMTMAGKANWAGRRSTSNGRRTSVAATLRAASPPPARSTRHRSLPSATTCGLTSMAPSTRRSYSRGCRRSGDGRSQARAGGGDAQTAAGEVDEAARGSRRRPHPGRSGGRPGASGHRFLDRFRRPRGLRQGAVRQ